MTRLELHELPGYEAVDAVHNGSVTVTEVAESALQQIAERDSVVRAFVNPDPDLVHRSANHLDARGQQLTPLSGMPIAVKDLIDTADFPTEFGSPIYKGRRPQADAGVVSRLKEAGALIIGKTVTTEFALFEPGPTTNPRDARRSPGGSSSGSAAATADHMVAAALGTQTAGSTIRPASFCGVVGFKPTFGAIDRTGVKVISPSLDTLGIFARNVSDVKLVFEAVGARSPIRGSRQQASGPCRLGLVRTPDWTRADRDTRHGLERLCEQLSARGFEIADIELPEAFNGLAEAQVTVMEQEVGQALSEEFEYHSSLLSHSTRTLLERIRASAPDDSTARRLATQCRAMLPEIFAEHDALITPAAVGEATPIESTGDPIFCRSWTLLHTPSISLPLLTGSHRLPIGVQMVGRIGGDLELLGVAEEVMEVVRGHANGAAQSK